MRTGSISLHVAIRLLLIDLDPQRSAEKWADLREIRAQSLRLQDQFI